MAGNGLILGSDRFGSDWQNLASCILHGPCSKKGMKRCSIRSWEKISQLLSRDSAPSLSPLSRFVFFSATPAGKSKQKSRGVTPSGGFFMQERLTRQDKKKPYLHLHHPHPAQNILGCFLRGHNRHLTRGPTFALQETVTITPTQSGIEEKFLKVKVFSQDSEVKYMVDAKCCREHFGQGATYVKVQNAIKEATW